MQENMECNFKYVRTNEILYQYEIYIKSWTKYTYLKYSMIFHNSFISISMSSYQSRITEALKVTNF